MWLGAPRCSPARGVALRITQLRTTAPDVRFRTMAVASGRRNSSQHCRCVRKKRKGAAQGKESQEVDTAEGAPPRYGSAEEPTHCRILRKAREKTDSSSRSKILLPESWNPVEGTPPRRGGTGRFPIQTGDRSDLNLEDGFGACTETLSRAKLNIIRYLF